MFGQITNKKGENLYILTSVSTNDIKPYFHVDTWERCKELFTKMTIKQDDDSFFAQLIHKKLNDELGTAKASIRCNKKGWGSDFFKYITIEPLYTQSWE